jgi:hypothetical protein
VRNQHTPTQRLFAFESVEVNLVSVLFDRLYRELTLGDSIHFFGNLEIGREWMEETNATISK